MKRWTFNILAAFSMVISFELIALWILSHPYQTKAYSFPNGVTLVSEFGGFGVETQVTPRGFHTTLLPYWLLTPVAALPALAWLCWRLMGNHRRKALRGFDVSPPTADSDQQKAM